MTTATPLQVDRRPRARRVAWLLAGLAVVALGVWYAHSPAALPLSDRQVTAATPQGQPVYLGVFTPPDDFGRTLHLSGVKVHTTSNTQVEVTPLLCRGGAVGVTSEPETFCTDLVDPEGQQLSAGDAIVLEVTSDVAAIAVIDRVRLGFRDGLRWGTLEAGSDAVVRVLGR